ncbi:MAG: histidine kinase [Ekhidna sp.]|uniref:histidine kinase n=1 Tax=Ekhidna sp. TaxID=2608089 RepID=UPI0032EC8B20
MRTVIFHIVFLWSFLLISQDDFSAEIERIRSVQSVHLDSALSEVDELLSGVLESGDDGRACQCLELKGNTLTKMRSYEDALIVLDQAVDRCSLAGDKPTLANALNAMGVVFDRLDDHEPALEYFIRTSQVYDEMDDYTGLVKSYMNMVSIFGQQEQVDKVKEYIEKAVRLIDKVDDLDRVARTYSSAAAHYSEIGFKERNYLDSASLLSKRGVVFAKEHELKESLPDYYIVLATVDVLQERPNRALAYCDSVFMNEESASYRALIIASMRKAESYAQLKDFDGAIKWYDSAEVMIEEVESLFYKMVLEESKYESFKAMGNTAAALVAFENFKALEDSVFTMEKYGQIADLEAKYEAEKKAGEISALKNQVALQEAQSSRKTWIIAFIVGITLLTISSFWFYYQRKLSLEKEQSAIHKQQLLRSQINPHFIFNSLSSIRGFLFDGNDTKPAITYLGKFAKLMRMVLELSSKEWVSLEEEIKALELYLEIQQIRFNRAFDFNLSVDPSIDPREIIVPPLTAQPFIENAIEHGLKGMDKNGRVEIACLRESGKLIFKIQDNGIGIDHVEPRKNHQSRAIQIFKERLGIIGKRMKMTFSFSIADIGNDADIHGTLVTYELPLVKG